jgi:two-component system, NtrC family, sensor kinase
MLRKFSLPAKVTFLLSLVVFVVVFGVTFVINKISEQSIVNDLKERSTKAANEITKELGEKPQLPPTDDIEDTILNALEINRSITEISVFKMKGSEPEFAATSSRANQIPVTDEIRTSIQTAIPSAHLVDNEDERFWNIVVPIYHRAAKSKQATKLGAVTVLTSLKQADRITAQNLQIALIFAPASILLLVILLNILFRYIIHNPVKKIQEAMAEAEAGDLNAEVRLNSSDELGMIAASYNRMLRQIREATTERISLIERINNFNIELKSKVESATAELTKRNSELHQLNERLLKMQLELVQLERLAVAGQLTATFAHEVGTPLNLISGHVQLLIESFSDKELISRKLSLVQSQIHRLNEIVRRFLDATRRPKLDLAPVDVNQLIQEVSALIVPTLQTRRVRCHNALQPDLPLIHADRKQLEQVLLNLINNSLDAMPKEGHLRIETGTTSDHRVAIRITDSGQGIEPTHMERLFQPMFTTKQIGQGTGLGLTICRAIIKEHGGDIEVKSVVGQGTTFSIFLPAEVPVMQD